jgi:alpha-galactosidase
MPVCGNSFFGSITRRVVRYVTHDCKWLISLSIVLVLLSSGAGASENAITNHYLAVAVGESDGSYEIRNNSTHEGVLRSRVSAQINHHWLSSNDYPTHRITQSEFDDVLGRGQQLTVTSTGLPNRPDLVCIIRVYEDSPFGDMEVQVHNRTLKPVTVQAIRSLDASGQNVVNLDGPEASERVLSDTFSEGHVQVYDLGRVPQGMHLAVGSQLIYNLGSKHGLFFGALSADRFLTILQLQVDNEQGGPKTKSYTIDSTGTTEVRARYKWFRQLSEDRVQLSLPVASHATMSSERLMFALGDDYHTLLENYGVAIRKLHHARVDGPSLMGWWTSPVEYNMSVNEGQAYTNAEWVAQHLKPLGYEFFQIDSPYKYSYGDYTHPNAQMYPHGMRKLGADVSALGLKFGIWVGPFQVGKRSWVFEHHKDWLVRNAHGQPIEFRTNTEAYEPFCVLDTTNPGAQEYLRQTYRTLTREWGVKYIKVDYMDLTTVEGYYYRPYTTALEALRIGLEVIRDAVGDDVLLDKDGSPMLTPVGIVDEGRVSGDAGHSFAIWKDRSTGIIARYYMHRNFFVNDPDAFTLLKEVPVVPQIPPNDTLPGGTLTLDEAQMSLVLAANTGGMFSIGDDLPRLDADPERAALITNKDILQMVKLGRASRPLDLLEYSSDDLQPSITFLREDDRQSVLTVFNWTEQRRSHEFALGDLGLPAGHVYKLYDVLGEDRPLPFDGNKIVLTDQRPHSVRLMKIIDESQPPMPPQVTIEAPESGKIDETLGFSVRSGVDGVLPLDCHWRFGDGVTGEGANVHHAYTLAGTYTASVAVDGLDGIPAQKTFSIKVAGYETPAPPVRYIDRTDLMNGGQPQ